MSMSNTHILLIGAGLAGLSLAHGLKQHNIQFHIFERDDDASFRAQGYRIRVSPEGADALKRLLPPELWSAFEGSSAEAQPGMNGIDATTGERPSVSGPGPRGPPPSTGGKSFNADRAVLRRLLLAGLEESVSFGKKFSRYELVNGGGVEVHLEDGTSHKGTMVVGADGVRSAVRKQLMPQFQLLDTEGRAIFGKTPLDDQMLSELPPTFSQGITLTSEGQQSRMKLFCDIMNFDRGPQAMDLAIPSDYLYWVLVFRLDELNASDQETLSALNYEQSADKATSLTSKWHKTLHPIFTKQDKTAASTLTFLSTDPAHLSQPWDLGPAQNCVTLLGDSAHAMPPVGGVGANTAFQDAADLCDAICSSPDELSRRMRDFEETMRKRAETAVQRSMGGAGMFFGMRPIAELKPAVF